MSRIFFTKVKLLRQKTVLKVSLIQLFIITDSYEAQKFTDLRKLSTLIHTDFFQFLYVLGRRSWGPDTNANPYEL